MAWDLPHPGTKLESLESPALAGRFFTTSATWEALWATMLMLSLQSCPTLCDPIDGSPPGSPVPGILQARTLEWVAISFSHALKWKVKVKSLSRVELLATPWTAAYQAPPSMGFFKQWATIPQYKIKSLKFEKKKKNSPLIVMFPLGKFPSTESHPASWLQIPIFPYWVDWSWAQSLSPIIKPLCNGS